MKNILITGANRGLGKQTVLQLAKQNHQVILTARDPKKGQAAADALKKETGKKTVYFLQLDLDKESDIAKAAQFVQQQFQSRPQSKFKLKSKIALERGAESLILIL